MKHNTLNSPQGEVHYWVSGEGEQVILFTHGVTMDHGLFQYQVEYFSGRYKVICWDVPAHGLSRPYQGFSLKSSARELVNILDQEGIQQAHLVGQSMGGYIIQIAAADYPSRALTLTAVDSSPVHPDYYSGLDRWLLAITPSLLRLYPYGYLIRLIAKQIALTETAQAYALKTLQGLTKEEIARIMQVVYQGVFQYARETPLPQPVLVVYGQSDRTGKVVSYSKRWAQMEQRELRVIPDAAHNANMDNPGAFNQVLEAFLRNQQVPG